MVWYVFTDSKHGRVGQRQAAHDNEHIAKAHAWAVATRGRVQVSDCAKGRAYVIIGTRALSDYLM